MRVYHTQDKSQWGDGPWQDEPDKVQWTDEETGLDCLIVRSYMGNLCGYVGVPEHHPAYEVRYGDCLLKNKCPGYRTREQQIAELRQSMEECDDTPEGQNTRNMYRSLLALAERRDEDPPHDYDECAGSLGSLLYCHGGITFSGKGMKPDTVDEWLGRDSKTVAHRQKLGLSPTSTYDEYLAWHDAMAICHIPEPNGSYNIWWLGFDCAHSMDFMPGYMALTPGFEKLMRDGTYRDMEYVKSNCRNLAKQLALIVPMVDSAIEQEVLDTLEI